MRFAAAITEPTRTPNAKVPTCRQTIKRLLAAAALLATTALTGIGFGTAPAHAEDEIRIGVIYPLTGAAASTGVELKAAAELAAALPRGRAVEVMSVLAEPFAEGTTAAPEPRVRRPRKRVA